jgi:hypothetical protein
MPPPDTTLRRRPGYRAIDTEDLTHSTAITDEPEIHQEAAEDARDERDVVQREGWEDLLLSFLASGAMTVCSVPITFVGYFQLMFIFEACCVFFPDCLCDSAIREVPSSRMALVFYS